MRQNDQGSQGDPGNRRSQAGGDTREPAPPHNQQAGNQPSGNVQSGNQQSGTVYGPSLQVGGAVHGGVHVHAARAAEVPPPDEVPRTRVRLVDREELRARVGDGLAAPGTRVPWAGVITGQRGVGKSTVAYWCAEREAFPDGRIYVDFTPLRDGVGGDLSAALAQCLRSLGVPGDLIPDGLQERANRFRTLTAGRRVLLVLDDVTEPAQVRTLIPQGPGSAVLATSQYRLPELSHEDVALLEVAPLSPEHGRELLVQRCGARRVAAEPEAADRLVELCAGLPLALHVVASRLTRGRRPPSLTALAEELADENRRLDRLVEGEQKVSAVLTLSYRELPDDARRLYRRLGLLPGPSFDEETAARAVDLDLATTRRLLEVLDRASLLADDSRADRYRLHDLVRLHARERAREEEPADEPAAVLRRVADLTLVRVAHADRTLRADRLRIVDLGGLLADHPNPFAGQAKSEVLEWLDSERANVLAVLRGARGRPELDPVVWRLAECFTALYLHHRYLAEWREVLTSGAEAAARVGETAAEARLRSLLSRPLLDLGWDEAARRELQRAVEAADAAGHPVLRASVREFLGRSLDGPDPEGAVAAYRLSIELNEAAGEARGVAIARFFLGRALGASGDHTAALTTLREAHAQLLALPDGSDPRMAARALAALGAVQRQVGQREAAARSLAEAADVLRRHEAFHYEAEARIALATLLEETDGEPEAVRAEVERAREIHELGGSPEAERLREWLARLAADGSA